MCGELQTFIDWAEQRPSAASNPIAEAGGEDERIRRRDRLRRIKVLNDLLSLYGLSVSDWGGTNYIISDKKGKSFVVRNLAALWPAVERLIGRPLDPLDEELLKSLEMKGGEYG